MRSVGNMLTVVSGSVFFFYFRNFRLMSIGGSWQKHFRIPGKSNCTQNEGQLKLKRMLRPIFWSKEKHGDSDYIFYCFRTAMRTNSFATLGIWRRDQWNFLSRSVRKSWFIVVINLQQLCADYINRSRRWLLLRISIGGCCERVLKSSCVGYS